MYCPVFLSFAHLRTLKHSLPTSIVDTKASRSFPQITSLVIERFNRTLGQLESFLSPVPLFRHLRLIGTKSYFDDVRWEQFVQINLPCLYKLELFLFLD